jgi:TRAP-type C4-dicarboxylate transport system substrate-binding protein
MVRGFGAIPTSVEVSELPTALMTGMVIGQENPLTMINANKLYEVQTHVMLTSHMQNVLPVFINERVWQQIGEKDRSAILGALDGLAQESLRMAQKAEQDLIGELKKKGMTIITASDGLKVEEFRKGVAVEVEKDFPSWKPYMQRISAIK